MKKIIFITNILRQPRCIRRINDFISRGYEVKVYGFDRSGDNRVLPTFSYECLGVNSNTESYLQRLLKMRKAIADLIIKEGNNSLYYIFSLDVAMAALSTNRKIKFCYEVSDLMELQINNKILSRILVAINRRVVKKAKLTIYTSEGFIDYLNPIGCKQDKTVILPNKLNNSCLKTKLTKEKTIDFQNIRFGFTGAIRTETIYNIVKAIGEYGKHEVHLYGIFSDETNGRYSIKSLVDLYSNVYYHGSFKNPDDFPEIYSNIDVVLCYYKSSRNDLYLEPNKLYEAMFYDCPIIVADDTFVGEKVKELNIGYVISEDNENSLIDFIHSINKSNFEEKLLNIKKISKEECIDNPKMLFTKIEEL